MLFERAYEIVMDPCTIPSAACRKSSAFSTCWSFPTLGRPSSRFGLVRLWPSDGVLQSTQCCWSACYSRPMSSGAPERGPRARATPGAPTATRPSSTKTCEVPLNTRSRSSLNQHRACLVVIHWRRRTKGATHASPNAFDDCAPHEWLTAKLQSEVFATCYMDNTASD